MTKDTGFGTSSPWFWRQLCHRHVTQTSGLVWFGFFPYIGQYLYHEVVMEMKQVNFLKSARGNEVCRVLEGCIYVVLGKLC